MLGRLLCRLGVHCPMESGRSIDDDRGVGSTWGFCVRNHKNWVCNWPWQLDN